LRHLIHVRAGRLEQHQIQLASEIPHLLPKENNFSAAAAAALAVVAAVALAVAVAAFRVVAVADLELQVVAEVEVVDSKVASLRRARCLLCLLLLLLLLLFCSARSASWQRTTKATRSAPILIRSKNATSQKAVNGELLTRPVPRSRVLSR
jgi:hypothetical protein